MYCSFEAHIPCTCKVEPLDYFSPCYQMYVCFLFSEPRMWSVRADIESYSSIENSILFVRSFCVTWFYILDCFPFPIFALISVTFSPKPKTQAALLLSTHNLLVLSFSSVARRADTFPCTFVSLFTPCYRPKFFAQSCAVFGCRLIF